MHTSWTRAGLILVAAFALTSCDRSVAPSSTGELQLSVVSGDLQSGSAGQELPNPLVVKVTKPNGSPVNNQILNFRVVSGGGSVFAGTALTDSHGIGQERWTLGSGGEQKVEVRAVDNTTGAPLVFATFTATVVCHDCWTTLAPMNRAREAAGHAAANGKLYVIGGDTGTSSRGAVGSVEEYDPASNHWTFKANMPSHRSGLAAATVNGIVFAVGGRTASATVAILEAYDPATDTWTTKAPMPTPRAFLSLVAYNGLLYAISGLNENGDNSSAVEVYDPATNSWTQKAPHFGRYGAGTVAVAGTIYTIGGSGGTGEPSVVVQAYDIATDTWSLKASLPASRALLGAAAVGGKIYAIGGYSADPNGNGSTNDAYDISADSWTQKTQMLTPRNVLGVTAINGVVYTAAGRSNDDGNPSNVLEAYRP